MIIKTKVRLKNPDDGEFTYEDALINTDHVMTVLPSEFPSVVTVVMPGGNNLLVRTGYETFLPNNQPKLAAVSKKGKK